MVSLRELERIAEIEFSDIVDTTELIGVKLRIILTEGSFINVWLSRKLPDRFGFHWEGKKQDYLIVTTIFLIPNGNMFLRIHIIFTVDHKTR